MEINDEYLGFQLLKPAHRVDSYNFLFEKFENKLAGWKGIFLTSAGKLILIKHVLGLIPHQPSLLPKAVLEKLTRIIRNFWWGHSHDTKKRHFIKWDKFNDEKEVGGLRIRSLMDLNRAQIAKLIWKLLDDPDYLWSQIMRAKYPRTSNFLGGKS